MKLFLSLTLFFSSHSAWAKIPLAPGLWDIKFKLDNNGQSIDLQSEMKKMYDNMSAEEKKRMEQLLSKMGKPNLSFSDPTKICYTKAQLDNHELLKQKEFSNCDFKVTKRIGGLKPELHQPNI